MSDKTEPLAAILAEMRDDRIIRLDGADVTRCMLHNLADRIEEAATQTRADLDAAHAAIATLEEELERLRAPGNAAAMRGLLEMIRQEYGWGLIGCRTCVSSEADVERVSDLFEKQIDAVLAAPARNCDVSRDTKETIERCLASLNVESSSASFDAGVCAAIGWMLTAPAKGGAE